jgi:hypothetical protein
VVGGPVVHFDRGPVVVGHFDRGHARFPR